MDLSLDTNIKNSSIKTHLHITPAKLISQFVEELKRFGVSLQEFIGGRIFFQTMWTTSFWGLLHSSFPYKHYFCKAFSKHFAVAGIAPTFI